MLDREHLGLLDIRAARNAFGRQLRSFEAELELDGVDGGPIHAVFIRAPWVDEHGDAVEVLAESTATRSPSGRATSSPSRSTPSSPARPALHELLLGMNGAAASRSRAGARVAVASIRGTAARTPPSRTAARRRARAAAARRPAPRRRGGSSESLAAREPDGQRADDDPGRVDQAGEQPVVGQRGDRADDVQRRGARGPAGAVRRPGRALAGRVRVQRSRRSRREQRHRQHQLPRV